MFPVIVPDYINTGQIRKLLPKEKVQRLEDIYTHNPHPDHNTKQMIAKDLSLNSRAVDNWFYRRRKKAVMKGKCMFFMKLSLSCSVS